MQKLVDQGQKLPLLQFCLFYQFGDGTEAALQLLSDVQVHAGSQLPLLQTLFVHLNFGKIWPNDTLVENFLWYSVGNLNKNGDEYIRRFINTSLSN